MYYYWFESYTQGMRYGMLRYADIKARCMVHHFFQAATPERSRCPHQWVHCFPRVAAAMLVRRCWDGTSSQVVSKRRGSASVRFAKSSLFWGAQHFGGNGVVWKNSDSATSNVMKIRETQWPTSHACFRTHHHGLCKDLEWKDHQLLQGWVRVERSLLKSVDQWSALRLKLKDTLQVMTYTKIMELRFQVNRLS